MQKDSQTVTKLQIMFIGTLCSNENSANFQLAEIWVLGPPP